MGSDARAMAVEKNGSSSQQPTASRFSGFGSLSNGGTGVERVMTVTAGFGPQADAVRRELQAKLYGRCCVSIDGAWYVPFAGCVEHKACHVQATRRVGLFFPLVAQKNPCRNRLVSNSDSCRLPQGKGPNLRS